jgi:hypothetical protein
VPPRKQQLAVLGPISPISIPISIPISPISSAPHLDLGVAERPARPGQQPQPP